MTLDSADPDLLEPGTWMEFHNDAFTLPPGATPLARNEVGLQAFALDRHPRTDERATQVRDGQHGAEAEQHDPRGQEEHQRPEVRRRVDDLRRGRGL